MEHHDLIVVGGGAAGIAGAIAAYDTGISDTLIIEKNEELGGSLNTATAQDDNHIEYESYGTIAFKKELTREAYLAHFLKVLGIYEVPTSCNTCVTRIAYDDASSSAPGFIVTVKRIHADGISENQIHADATSSEKQIHADAVLLASGTYPMDKAYSNLLQFISPMLGESDNIYRVDKSRITTSLKGLYIAGDILHKNTMPDIASLEGAKAGREIAAYLIGKKKA